MKALGRTFSILFLLGALVPTPAHAGGWWSGIDLPGDVIAVGETFTFRGETRFETPREARAGRETPFFVYLIQDLDQEMVEEAMSGPEPESWWEPPVRSAIVGDVQITRRDGNLVWFRTDIEIPQVPLRDYSIMLCNQGCREPLGSVVPVGVQVTADTAAAQNARAIDQLTNELRSQRANLLHRINGLRGRITNLRADADSLESRLDSGASAPLTTATATSETPWTAYAGWYAAGALSMLLLALAVRRRKPAPVAAAESAPEPDRVIVLDEPPLPSFLQDDVEQQHDEEEELPIEEPAAVEEPALEEDERELVGAGPPRPAKKSKKSKKGRRR